MAGESVITVEGLWKRYGIPVGQQVRRSFARMIRPQTEQVQMPGPWALRDVNMEIRQGETVGLIGRNGAGKSTLLKVLAGVSPPTWGRVQIRQRLFPMIELNAGIHFDLTGRENVYLLGSIMGLSRPEMNAKMPDIEEFCELGDWLDKPVRMYSSGMMARLGFAVAMNVEAEILLIDEVLAVGDMMFQRKCHQRLDEMRSKGVTTLFVSHSIRQMERLCERCYLFQQGQVILDGPADEGARLYMEMVEADRLKATNITGPKPLKAPSSGTGEMYVTGVTVLDKQGGPTETLGVFEDVVIKVDLHAIHPMKTPGIAVALLTADMIQVILQTNENSAHRPDFNGDGTITCRFTNVKLVPGAYQVKVSIKGHDGRSVYKEEGLANFTIKTEDFSLIRESGGVVYSTAEWS